MIFLNSDEMCLISHNQVKFSAELSWAHEEHIVEFPLFRRLRQISIGNIDKRFLPLLKWSYSDCGASNILEQKKSSKVAKCRYQLYIAKQYSEVWASQFE